MNTEKIIPKIEENYNIHLFIIIIHLITYVNYAYTLVIMMYMHVTIVYY